MVLNQAYSALKTTPNLRRGSEGTFEQNFIFKKQKKAYHSISKNGRGPKKSSQHKNSMHSTEVQILEAFSGLAWGSSLNTTACSVGCSFHSTTSPLCQMADLLKRGNKTQSWLMCVLLDHSQLEVGTKFNAYVYGCVRLASGCWCFMYFRFSLHLAFHSSIT